MLPLFVDSQFIFTEISQENKSFPHHSFTAPLNEAIDSSLNRFEDSLCPNDQNRRISHVQTIYSPFFETSEKYNEYMISSSYSVGDSVFKPLHSRGKIRQKLHCPSEKTTCDTASPSYDRDLLSKTSHKPEKVFFSNGNFEPEFPSAENVRKLTGYRTTENLTDDTKTSTELLYPERIIELKADRNQERPNNMIFNEKKEASNCADDEWKYWYGRVIGDEQEIKGGLEVLRRKPHNRQELRDAIRKWHDIQADKFVKEAKTSYY